MSLTELFNGQERGKLIYRGDCTKRGYLGSAIFEEGKRFEITTESGVYTIVADKVKVMPIGYLTEEDFEGEINGGVSPLTEEDLGPVTDELEPCTIVEFEAKTVEPVPRYWILQQEARPA